MSLNVNSRATNSSTSYYQNQCFVSSAGNIYAVSCVQTATDISFRWKLGAVWLMAAYYSAKRKMCSLIWNNVKWEKVKFTLFLLGILLKAVGRVHHVTPKFHTHKSDGSCSKPQPTHGAQCHKLSPSPIIQLLHQCFPCIWNVDTIACIKFCQQLHQE